MDVQLERHGMTKIDLLDVWGARAADTAELEDLLVRHFGEVGFSDGRYAIYGSDPSNPRLIVTYNKRGKPAQAVAGPGFTTADSAALSGRIHDALLQDGTPEIGRRVLFTTLRVDGFYRYRDLFQIVPVPADAPRPQMAMLASNPFLLEVRYHRSSESMTSMLRKERAEREIELLLAVFLWLPIEHLGNVRFRWVLKPGGDPHPTSSHQQEGYHWPGDRPVRDAFTPTDTLAPLPGIEPNLYYARYNYSVTDSLDLPSNLTDMLDRFFALDLSDRQDFLRAAYWFYHASNVWVTSHSAAFTAMVSAVEAIMPPVGAASPCPTCKRPATPGPTARFEAFVDQHASARQIAPEQRKAFYRTRSALTHGGRLLQSDQRTWGAGITSVVEMQDLRMLSSVVRAVLCDWLQHARST